MLVVRWASFETEICMALAAGDKEEAVRVYREQAWPNLFADHLPGEMGADASHADEVA